MKFSLLAAAALLFTATAASAQISPSEPQRGGSMNQTTVQPQNPANPATNPGTIDQRTPTTTNPTQTSLPGAIDQQPTTMPTRRSGDMRGTTPTGTPRTRTMNNGTGTMNNGTRTINNGTRVRTAPGTTTPSTTTPAGTTRP